MNKYIPPIIFISVFLILWESIVISLNIPTWLIPAPHKVAERFFEASTLPLHTQLTAIESVAGFSLSVILGISLATLMAHLKFAENALLPYITILNSIPVVAIAPLLTIWFGFGLEPKIVTAMIISLAPIVINTHKGLKSTDYRIYELMKSIDATHAQTIKKIEFPNALPYIFAGFKISMPLSIIGAVVAEFYGADHGLGYLVILTATQLQTELLFVTIGILAFMGIVSFAVFSVIERKFAWRKE